MSQHNWLRSELLVTDASYQPGDICRDVDGNVWVRSYDDSIWILVYIFNCYTVTNSMVDLDDNLRLPYLELPLPLVPIVRDGHPVFTFEEELA